MTDADFEWFKDQFRQAAERMDQKFERMEEKMTEGFRLADKRIEKCETSLLTEFHIWMEMDEKRHKELRANLLAKDLKFEAMAAEMDIIKTRLAKLEGRQSSS